MKFIEILIPNPRLNQTNGFESEGAGSYMQYVRKAESRKIYLDQIYLDHLKMLLGIILLFCISACTSQNKEKDIITPAVTLYQSGLDYLTEKKYSEAAEEFEKIFFQHPGNAITPQAELMEAYCLFLNGKYNEAIDVLEVFIKLHPMNIDSAYAYYLRGLCFYMQISSVDLDQSNTESAKLAFEELIKRHPASKYSIDAALKMDLVNDHLAGHSMEIGRFYLTKQDPMPAMKRFQAVISQYQTTSHIKEALYRMVECCVALGLQEESLKYASVLGHNYADSQWYHKAYLLIKESKNVDKNVYEK